MVKKELQPEVNIGLIGHVDHGKTTLTKALSGIWTDRHSEEIKRGISIRLGYANCTFYRCSKCPDPQCFGISEKCIHCGSKTDILRTISFVDSPGHETLMAVMLSGAAMMDGAVLVIAANEKCPQPQTAEHLAALNILEVKNVVIAQNKIDTVSKERAVESYHEIKDFVKGTIAENAPVIPIAANYNSNIDVLIEYIESVIKNRDHDGDKKMRMYIARSFDINKPGQDIEKIEGGAIGGTIISGKLKVGDNIEILPGARVNDKYVPLTTKITSLHVGDIKIRQANPGGLISAGTKLDPYLTGSDRLAGSVAGLPGSLPEVHDTLSLKIHLFDSVVGIKSSSSKNKGKIKPIAKGESLMLSVGSAVTLGIVREVKKAVKFDLKIPVCADGGQKVAISRRIDLRWRLIGYGTIVE